MGRRTRHGSSLVSDGSGRHRSKHQSGHRPLFLERRLRFEPLEDRRLLTTFVVNTLVDENNGIGVGGVSLRDAVAAAVNGDTINFATSLTSSGPATINLLNQGHILINKNLSINGPGANLLTIKAFDPDVAGTNDGDGLRIFNVDDGTATVRTVSISGLTLTNGDVTGPGGAIRNAENLTLSASVITGNAATVAGGGLYNLGASAVLTVNNSTVSNNSTVFGGGLFNGNGTLNVNNSTISGNTVTGNGGGIQNNFGTLNVTNSKIWVNSGGGAGGGILTYFDALTTVNGSTISGNTAVAGAGIWARASHVFVTATTIDGNKASGSGGGIFNYYGQFTASRSTISNNTAQLKGGGVFSQTTLSTGQITQLLTSTVSNNAASDTSGGGGVMNVSGSTVIQNSTIVLNIAGGLTLAGGVGSQGNSSTLTSVYSTIIGGNNPFGLGEDVSFVGGGVNSFSSSGYNVISRGNALGAFNKTGDQTLVPNIIPTLGPLADNGGPTRTHALLPGNPAIDTGDLSIPFNPAEFDQRGAPFVRVFNGDNLGTARIDVGAQERQDFGAPQTLVVDILADDNDGNYSAGDLSLREAIGLVNGNVGISETVNFHGSLNGGTITLTHGTLTIDDPVWVNGPGADLLTIDASGNDPTPNTNNGDGSQVFINEIRGGLVLDATISGLTVTGGDTGFYSPSGGGILNEANLTISGVTIRDNNTTGGIGGGIRSVYAGSLTVINSTISGNSASFGGGIYFHNYNLSSAPLTITNSTISGNTAGHHGGGVEVGGGPAVINNSTITNNISSTAEGGGVSSQGSSSRTRTEVTSTIIAGNTGGDVFFTGQGSGGTNTFQSNGYNLIGTGNAVGDFNQSSDQVIGSASPLLSPLANHGGPTMTHALLVGSPALDAGISPYVGSLTTDQRGAPFVRVFDGDGAGGARIDIGAYERQAVPGLNLVADTLVDENDGIYTAGDLSLREAILLANGSVGPNTITFSPSLTNGSIVLRLGDLFVTDSLTISGLGANLLTIDASGNDPTSTYNNGDGSRVFRIDDGDVATFITVSVSGLTLTGGDADFRGGGAIECEENLTVTNCTIIGNAAVGTFGGGIRADQAASLTVTGSTISGNVAQGGGGIYSTNGNVLALSGSTVTGNSATSSGGGVYHNGNVNWTISSSTISGNTAAVGGGGVYSRRGHLYLDGSTVSGNTAAYGGGIFHTLNNLSVSNCTISGNQSPNSNGGGIEVVNATMMSVFNSTISGNSSGAGGGILSYFTTSSLASCTITNNFGSVAGGGLNVFGGTLTMTHTIVAGNTGVSRDISGAVTATYCIIGDNTGASIGGSNNQIGSSGSPINPMLGPLADNLGPTKTHALLTGSPAIDAGSPTYLVVPAFDQRGDPFTRYYNGDGIGSTLVDIGAFELQPLPLSASGDFSQDHAVGAADFAVWRKTFGNIVSPYSGADGNGNRVIDQGDYDVWRSHFGQLVPAAGAGSGASVEMGVGSGEGTTALAGPVATSEGEETNVGPESLISARGADSVSQPPALPGVDVAAEVQADGTRPRQVESLTGATFDTAGQARSRTHSWTLAEAVAPVVSREAALLAWLSSRGDRRAEGLHDTGAVTSDEVDAGVTDESLTALNAAFGALSEGMQ